MEDKAYRIGRRIRAFRQLRNLTQTALAGAADVDPSYLSQIESGKRQAPSVEVLGRLAEALHVEVKDLMPAGEPGRLLGEIQRLGPLLQAAGIEPERLVSAFEGDLRRMERLDRLFGDLLSGLGISQEAFIRELLRTELAASPESFERLEEIAARERKGDRLGGEPLTLERIVAFLAAEGLEVREKLLTRPTIDDGIRCEAYLKAADNILLIDDRSTRAERSFQVAREVAHRLLKHIDRAPEHPAIQPTRYDHVRMNQQSDYLATCLLVDRKEVEEVVTAALRARTPDEATGALAAHLRRNEDRVPIDVQFVRVAQVMAHRFHQMPYYLQLRDEGEGAGSPRFVIPSWLFPRSGALRGMDADDLFCARWLASKVLMDLSAGVEGARHGAVFVQRSFLIKQREALLTFTLLHAPQGRAPSTLSFDIPLVDEILYQAAFLQHDRLLKRDLGETCRTCPILEICEDHPPRLRRREVPLSPEKVTRWRRYLSGERE